MSLTPGIRIGAFEIGGSLGAGGMGEVYQATDTTLGRQVAIKVLPAAMATDVERVTRFEREARTLAALNHPNIAQVYGFEKANGVHALVMEFVEGPTLADVIARRAGSASEPAGLPIDEVLPIAKQIAEALEAAHEQGIIHRDLKPANIKLREDGTVKVLDFGLAKAIEQIGSGPGAAGSDAPTMTSPALLTGVGVILGTAAYMSPEQARGQTIDRRADIWAFGCVLFEMLTGRAAFGRATVTDTLAAVIGAAPDWTTWPQPAPPTLKRWVVRCLEKDQRRRPRDIADVRFALEDLASVTEPVAQPSGRGGLAPVFVAVLVLAGFLAGWAINESTTSVSRSGTTAPEMRLQIVTPPTTDPVSLALSPDGLQVAFVASNSGQPVVWVQALDGESPRPLAGTEDGAFPFWSPDGRSLGFFANGLLKRIDLGVGTVQTLAPGSRGGAWNRDGTIIFTASPGAAALSRIAADGGAVTAATRREASQGSHRFPQFLPDGRHFIFFVVSGDAATRGVYAGELDSSVTIRLTAADSAAVYSSSGHLLFTRQGSLIAQPFDAASLELTGEPIPIAKGVPTSGPLWLAPVSASATGTFVYRGGAAGGERQFAWFDRSGRELQRVGSPVPNLLSPALSPDGRRVVVHRLVNNAQNLWMLDVAGGILSRLTSTRSEYHPVWSPDGRRLLLNADGNLYLRDSYGTGPEELLLNGSEVLNPTDWSSDGRYVLYHTGEPGPSSDIWALPMVGEKSPVPLVRTSFNEQDGQFSPDGKWIAYSSDESGRNEIYVQTFPDGARRAQVSSGGGAMPRWRRDGAELFYIALDGRLMAVPMTLGDPSAVARPPVPLFPTRIGGAQQGNSRQQYMVSANGDRFLLNTLAEETPTPITVVLNWKGGAVAGTSSAPGR